MDVPIVVDYGMGNIHSILKALRQYLPNVRYSKDEDEIHRAKALILPGDGAFTAAMAGLEGSLKESLLSFVRSGRPLLGICIGFQVLFEDSTEGEGNTVGDDFSKPKGLGLIPGHIRKFSFSDKTRIPHMGWNRLLFQPKKEPGEYMYFIHSYRATEVPPEFVLAYCNYGEDIFPAIIKKENIMATQFHPEKSGSAGLRLLEKWAAKAVSGKSP